jgi:spore coat protein U-like protein
MNAIIKKFFTLLSILIGSSCFAQSDPCSLSVPPAHLGTYNFSSGASTTLNMVSSCSDSLTGSALWIGGATASYYQLNLSNGQNSVTAYLSTALAPGGYYSNIPVCINARAGSNNSYMEVGGGTFCTNITIPAGINLTPGLYFGSIVAVFDMSNSNTGRYIAYKTITISLTVNSTCALSLSQNGFAFGNYNSQDDMGGPLTINSLCTNSTPYSISLSSGSSGNANSRTMKNGSASLNYNIYKDSSYTIPFGDGITAGNINLIGTGFLQSTTIYGKLPYGQRPTPGNYSDILDISLTY